MHKDRFSPRFKRESYSLAIAIMLFSEIEPVTRLPRYLICKTKESDKINFSLVQGSKFISKEE